MRIVGIDPSLRSTGYAEIHDGVLTLGTFGAPGRPTFSGRIARVQTVALSIVLRVVDAPATPDLVVIEGPSLGQRRQGGQFDRHGLWWIVVGDLHSHGVNLAVVPPASLKVFATGTGKAAKVDMMEAAARQWPHVKFRNHDQVDAAWLCAMGAEHLGVMPPAGGRRSAALRKIEWPDVKIGAN